jgi:ribulose-phosphate 3-epimerase
MVSGHSAFVAAPDIVRRMSRLPLRIAPSILSADFGRLAEEVAAVEAAGADLIHVDVMDGRFVPNLTIGPPVVSALRRATRLPLDVHLMIVEPERYVERFREAGADWISVHAEACTHLQRTLAQIADSGAKAAVALNPATPLSVLDWILEDLHMVLLMSVNPGFGGQSYLPQITRKVSALRETLERRGLKAEIEVDGGVKRENVGEITAAGANVLVAGSAIFEAKEYRRAIAELRAGAAAGER